MKDEHDTENWTMRLMRSGCRESIMAPVRPGVRVVRGAVHQGSAQVDPGKPQPDQGEAPAGAGGLDEVGTQRAADQGDRKSLMANRPEGEEAPLSDAEIYGTPLSAEEILIAKKLRRRLPQDQVDVSVEAGVIPAPPAWRKVPDRIVITHGLGVSENPMDTPHEEYNGRPVQRWKKPGEWSLDSAGRCAGFWDQLKGDHHG